MAKQADLVIIPLEFEDAKKQRSELCVGTFGFRIRAQGSSLPSHGLPFGALPELIQKLQDLQAAVERGDYSK